MLQWICCGKCWTVSWNNCILNFDLNWMSKFISKNFRLLMKQRFQSDCYTGTVLLNDFHLLGMIYWSPDQNLQHICTTYHEVTTTDKDWPSWRNIFPRGENQRLSIYKVREWNILWSEKYHFQLADICWESVVSVTVSSLSLPPSSSWSLSLPTATCWSHVTMCSLDEIMRGLLLSIQLSSTHRWLLISNTQKN